MNGPGGILATMKARLADIAAQARVSEATVSRVLNDKPGVAEPTRQSVLTAMDVLGYQRPTRLQRRPDGRGGLIGLVIPELDNPIFPAFAQLIQSGLARAGYGTVLCTQSPEAMSEDDYLELLLVRGVSGVVFVSGRHADSTGDVARYTRLRALGLPLVFVNGWADGVDAPFISNDDAASMDLAVSHLASLGHARIGLAVGPQRFVPVIRKIAGFREAMARHLGPHPDGHGGSDRLPADLDRLIECSLFDVEGGAAAAERLLDRGVTAVVCGSDLMALGAVRAVRTRGLRVPHDVSVVGYDDSPLVGFFDPPMTTVRQAVDAMGAAAVRALLEEIAGRPTPRGEFVFRPELVVRASTGPAPA